MLNIRFLACSKVELEGLSLYCSKWRKVQSATVTLTLIRQCPLSKFARKCQMQDSTDMSICKKCPMQDLTKISKYAKYH